MFLSELNELITHDNPLDCHGCFQGLIKFLIVVGLVILAVTISCIISISKDKKRV